jgi:hypothetical protein
MKRIWFAWLLGFALMVVTVACDDTTPTADQQQQRQQEKIAQQGNAQAGMPGVTNFTEKKIVKKLYELRDENIATFSYIPDMQGRLWHLCDSIGYGMPYGVQFTNPEKHIDATAAATSYELPQPEPNGLFMPPTAEGTWVICAAPKGDPVPVYVEPRVIVSPFKLNSAGDYQQK